MVLTLVSDISETKPVEEAVEPKKAPKDEKPIPKPEDVEAEVSLELPVTQDVEEEVEIALTIPAEEETPDFEFTLPAETPGKYVYHLVIF